MPGYAILDVDKETFDKEVLCECCDSVVRDARSAVCGHFFCSSCVENRFRKNEGGVSYCPKTRIPLFYFQFVPPDQAFCDRVDNLTVHCLFLSSGCNWIGKLQNFEDHVSGCEFAAAGHDGKEMAKCEVNHDKAVIEMHGGQMGAKQKTDSSVLTTPQVSFVGNGVRDDFGDPAFDTRIEDPDPLPKKCKFCKEPVELNAMERHCVECPAWPVKLGKCGKEEVRQAKVLQKEQLNSTLPLSRKLLPSSDKVVEKDKIALPPKEICGGKSVARSMSPSDTFLKVPIADQHEQRLNDLENKVAQHDSVLKQQVSDLTNKLCNAYRKIGCLEEALHRVHGKVDYLERAIYRLSCRQKSDYDIYQANLTALHNEICNVQDQMNTSMVSPFPQEERARLMESIQGIQQRIGRLEEHVQSHGNMIGAISTSLTRVANAVESDRIPAVDIRHL